MSEPLHIAQIVGKMNGGGVETVAMNYYRHIDRDAIQFDFFIDENSTMVPRDEIEERGGRIIELPSYTKLPRYISSLKGRLEQGEYKIAHSHINTLSVFSLYAAKKAGTPIRIAHSHSTLGSGEAGRNLLKSVLRPFSKVYPTHLVACSKVAGDWQFGKNANYRIIRNAIDLQGYAFDEDARHEVRSEFGIAGNAFVVGHIGRLAPPKNQIFLLQIFKHIRNMRPGSKLMIVGEGERKELIEGCIDEFGLRDSVIMAGYREDANRLYQAFDCFLLPSLYEGLPLVGVEALRSGLHVFFSDRVTTEIKLTDKAHFIPLASDSESWANEILREAADCHDRTVAPEAFAGYDIAYAAKDLRDYYLGLAEELGS